MSIQKFFSIFILISIVYVACIIFNLPVIEFYLKPLLILPLIVAVFISTNFKYRIILLIALIFSLAGDTLLLFVYKDASFFILGLVAFLTAHIFYIILFARELKKTGGKLIWKLPGFVVIIIYLAALLFLLIPHLGSLLMPVIIYSLVISSMLYMAYLLSCNWKKPASIFLMTGAIAFILSDSLLAINKFYHPIPLPGFFIMATYLYAQGALVRSCIK